VAMTEKSRVLETECVEDAGLRSKSARDGLTNLSGSASRKMGLVPLFGGQPTLTTGDGILGGGGPPNRKGDDFPTVMGARS
jgi:hypothetical protein